MANTYVDYTATASQTDFAFSFPFLEDSHVVVEIDGIDKTITTDFTIPSVGLVRLNSGATAGQAVRVKRVSGFDTDLVNFVNGSVLNEADLDKAYLHNRYLNEEAAEGNSASMQLVGGGTDYNAKNKKIVNLASPTASNDATNKDYVDTQVSLSGTNLNGFNKSTHTGDNTETEFTLSFTAQIATPEAYRVTIDGVVQTPTTAYSINTSTNKIVFTSAPPTSSEIVVVAMGTASSANDAQVVATGSTTARTLADRFTDVVNVKDFGAVGDGVADDSTAVQATINAANASGGGLVFFPEGTYELNDSVLTMYSNITLQGEGHSSIIQGWLAITASGLSSVTWRNVRIKGYRFVWSNCTDVLLENIYFENENFSDPSHVASRFCQFTNSSRFRIVNCYIENCQYGIWIGGPAGSLTSQNTDVVVENCHIKNTYATGYGYPAGINLADGKNVVLTKNHIEGIQPTTGTQGYGIYQGDNTVFKAENIVISNNTIEDCQFGIKLHNPSKAVVSDNVVRLGVGDSYQGIAAFGDLDVDGSIPSSFTVTGNVVHGADIHFPGWHKNLTISGNTVVGGNRGISTYTGGGSTYSYYVTIDGNTVSECKQTGILIQDTEYCTISNNTIIDCNTDGGATAFTSSAISLYTQTNNIYIHDNFIINETANGQSIRGIYLHGTSSHDLARKLAFNNIAFNVNVPMSGVYTAAPTYGTWEAGEKVYFTSPAAGGKLGSICTTRGTMDTLSGVTGSGSTGSPTLTVNSATDLRIGQHITVTGAGTHRIINIVGTTVTLATNLAATVSGVAVSFSAAVFKDFGAIDA